MLAVGKCSVTLRAHFSKQASVMKSEIHPQYHAVKATCSFGNVIEIGSTLSGDMLRRLFKLPSVLYRQAKDH